MADLGRDWPAYWFVELENAVEAGDHQRAAEAQANLKRLGVEVRYRARRVTFGRLQPAGVVHDQ